MKIKQAVEERMAGLLAMIKNNPPGHAINTQVLMQDRLGQLTEDARQGNLAPGQDESDLAMSSLNQQAACIGWMIMRCMVWNHLTLVFDDSEATAVPIQNPATN